LTLLPIFINKRK